jgi:uncharacterized protein
VRGREVGAGLPVTGDPPSSTGYSDDVDQHANFITIATPDLDAARAFYVTGLGWTPLLDVPDEIIFFQVGWGLTLGLFNATAFARDLLGPDDTLDDVGAVPQVSGLTLSHNVDSPAAVDTAFDKAVGAGGQPTKRPQQAAFGGYHAHVTDPSGLVWEIAFNPGWSVAPDGTVELKAVE